MRWRGNDWPAYRPRPKQVKLPSATLARLHDKTRRFVEHSSVLRELVGEVQLARGRIYVWRDDRDLMARLTPLSARLLLLEAPRGNGWFEVLRGAPARVLHVLECDPRGKFHSLGALASADAEGSRTTQQALRDDHGVPVRVLAEPRHWYAMHRAPGIVEADRDRGRVLVRFEAAGPFGGFHGTCLYARRDGKWGCYTIRPNASASIAAAEAWLAKRDWEDWG